MKKVKSYKHVRNNSCVYKRIGDSNTFAWKNHRRTESNILAEIELNNKFVQYEFEDNRKEN